MVSKIELAYDHCQQVAKTQAKNFYYAFRTLPVRKRRAIYAAYAFCRYCDDIADSEMPLEEKRRLFAKARDRLSNSMQGLADDDFVFTAVAHTIQEFQIPFEYLEQVIEGVEMDLTWSRFGDFEELKNYCYKVASVVGLICIEIFGYTDKRAMEYAVDLGIGMQLTNILRDVKEDADRGRIYLPLDDLATFGYSEHELMNGIVNDAFRNLMSFQSERARSYFKSGKGLIPLLSVDSRTCPAVLHSLYSKVLDRIEDSGYEVFQNRISLSKTRKLFIMSKIWVTSLMPAIIPFKR